jgi:hypothetical protein
VYWLVRGSSIFYNLFLDIITTVIIIVIIDIYVNDKKYSVFFNFIYVDFKLYTETLYQCDNAG